VKHGPRGNCLQASYEPLPERTIEALAQDQKCRGERVCLART
jgi:hypothetical protein